MIGVLSGITAEIPILPILMKKIQLNGIFVGSRETFEEMNRAIAWHGLKPVIDRVFPFAEAVGAFRYKYLNLGYQWNGESLLAGNVTTGETQDLAGEVVYAAGADVAVGRRLTLCADLVGRHVIDSSRVATTTFVGLDAASTTSPDIRFEQASFNQSSLALGFKVNPTGRLLVVFNVLLKLDDNGLRDKATPLLALDYTF